MKTTLALLILLSLQSCVENESKKNESKLESFQMSGNMAGYSCKITASDNSSAKVFIDGISFEHADSSMRFYRLDNKNNILDTSISVNGLDLWEALFDTSAYSEKSVDSAPISFYGDDPGDVEKQVVVRHWPKSNGLTQILSTSMNGNNSKLEAEISNCRPAIIHHTDYKVIEI